MRYLHPRCIVITNHARCASKARKRTGDIYVCREHARLLTMLLIDDAYAPETRRMLAHEKWETAHAGQRLIDRLHRRHAA